MRNGKRLVIQKIFGMPKVASQLLLRLTLVHIWLSRLNRLTRPVDVGCCGVVDVGFEVQSRSKTPGQSQLIIYRSPVTEQAFCGSNTLGEAET